MAVYTNDLRLKEIATGDESGTWGTSTNTNLSLVAEAFSFGTEAITTNADTHTTTIADGSTDPGRSLFLKYTGTLDSACTITIGPNTVSKLWLIENATSGSQNIIIKQGSGATVTVPNGQTKAIYSDGAGSGGAMVDAFTDLSVPSLFVSGDIDVDGTTNLDNVDIDGTFAAITGAFVKASSGGSATSDTVLTVEDDDNTEISILGGSSSVLAINFGHSGDNDEGRITFNTTAGSEDLQLISSKEITLDAGGDIILDADSGAFRFKDAGTTLATFTSDSQSMVLFTAVSDKDLIFKGNDGGSTITALTLDMSDGGTAIFGSWQKMADSNRIVFGAGSDLAIYSDGTDGNIDGASKIKLDAADEIHLDADAGIIRIQDDAGDVGMFQMTNLDFIIRSMTSDKDLIFKGNDGGSVITALTLDMSAAGKAIFNAGIVVNESGGNNNTRFEGENISSLFEIDASTDRIGIGTSSPSRQLSLSHATQAEIGFKTGSVSNGGLIYYNDSEGKLLLRAQESSDVISFETGGTTERMRIDSDGGTTITRGDNGAVLTLKSTDTDASRGPILDLNRESTSSAADNDYIGELRFLGNNDANESIPYAGIAGRIIDASDGTEDGRFEMYTELAGAQISRVLSDSTETVINQDSANLDFRVESDSNANALFVDAGNNNVAIGTNAPISLDGNATPGLTISSNGPFLCLQDANNSDKVAYISNNTGILQLGVVADNGASSKTEAARFSSSGAIFNEKSVDLDFRVESDADNKAFFVNGGDGVVSFGGMGSNTRSPSAVQPKFQANSLTRMDSSISLCCNSNDALASLLMFSKTRSGNLTGATAAQAGDAVGAITWNAADGTDIEHGIAAIDAVVESGISTNDTPGALRFYTNSGTTSASERMRITGSGKVCINSTEDLSGSMFSVIVPLSQTSNAFVCKPDVNGTTNAAVFVNSSGANAGFIQYTATTTTFATSSDYRMKENVVALSGATDRLKQLNPSRFNFIEDADITVDGFLAHEVQAVVPEAVTGTKDAVDADGNPDYQGIDQSKLVPLLVATIQELEARIAALESK